MWKKRTELPVMQCLKEYQFDPILLSRAYQEYTANKTWDGLGNEYASMCETYTKLPSMFFNEDELEGVNLVCDIDWEQASYQQISLVDFDETYSIDQRTEKSGTRWDTTVAKNNPRADERFFRKRHDDLPEYFHHVLDTIGNDVVHRTRFAKLAPQSSIKPHIDYNTEYGVRLHIPIVTNFGCSFGGIDHNGDTVEGHMPADGKVWYINPGVKHWARNDGDTERVHMIISVDSQKWFT
tara:strand:- start:1483 stop:2196 length:714 start_codon:yes stop_codon:yes gene_type:complete